MSEGRDHILFIGPNRFDEAVVEKNVTHIYPDLLSPICRHADISLATGPEEHPAIARQLTERFGVKLVRTKARLFKVLPSLPILARLVQREKISVLTNLHLGIQYGFLAAVVARLKRVRAVVRFAGNEPYARHCMRTYREPHRSLVYVADRLFEFAAANLAHAVIVMAPWELRRVRRFCFNKKKVQFCMRGVDLAAFRPASPSRGAAASKFLFVGRRSREKGYDIVEDAAKALYGKTEAIEFLFAGTFEPATEENRRYLGYCPPSKLAELFNDADVVVMPSRSEGFSQVVIEALATGTPVVTSAHIYGGFLSAEAGAVLIEADSKALAEQVVRLHRDPELVADLSRSARSFAEKHFDREEWCRRYKAILLGSENESKSGP